MLSLPTMPAGRRPHVNAVTCSSRSICADRPGSCGPLAFGLAGLFSGIAGGKRIEVALGAMATAVGLVIPFL